MAHALGLQLKQLMKHYEISVCLPDQTIPFTLRGLMNNLRDMMVGYENEEVLVLLKQMKVLVDRENKLIFNECMPFRRRDLTRSVDEMIVICEQLCNIRYKSDVEEEESVVGFDNEIEILLDQLTATSMKQFQIISITGMAGLGKTTLAKTLYNHDLIKYMFDFRAWICVSQTYLKKDLLLGCLSSFVDNLADEFYEMTEQQLGEKLYRKLKGRKYIAVFDDIWDCRVWNDLKMYFPNDRTGSRVLFTSRDEDLSLHVQSARPAHVLRLRTESESWGIFEKKVFRTRTGRWPAILIKSGQMINKKCDALPLAIVIAAGLLRNNFSITWWEQIAASLRSFMVSDPTQYTDSLALSYNHLPPHLRPCLLFFGAFPEDYEVPVRKLLWLWM